jgi:uncharacterized protein (DUF433 family)
VTEVRKNKKAQLLGRYIVADPEICHGKPTFRGTRIFVSDVLEMVAEGMAWETIIEQWHGSITKEAIAEAVRLSSEAFFKHTEEFVLEPVPA